MVSTKCAVWAGAVVVVACSAEMKVDTTPDPGGNAGGAGAGGVSDGSWSTLELDQGGTGEAGSSSRVSNAKECPSQAPGHASPCETDEGLVCAYVRSDEEKDYYAECQCVATSSTELKWDCYEQNDTKLGACPATEPDDGTPCEGNNLGHECAYPPRQSCWCGEDGNWSCSGPTTRDVPELPPSPKASRRVAELSDADRTAWCEWFVSATSGEGDEPEPAAVDESGFVNADDYGGMTCAGLATEAFLPSLPAVHCEHNLALSTCEAPISELSDCVVSVLNMCVPSPTGCGRYLDTPGCDGSIAISSLGTDASASENVYPMRVEAVDTNTEAPRPGNGLGSNAEGCPPETPGHASVCETDEGLVCAYVGSDGEQDYYTECQCVATSRTELQWNCYQQADGDFESCPDAEPRSGTACSGLALCRYPVGVTCTCEEGEWNCPAPYTPELPDSPATVDESTPVAQLADADRAAWCSWYADAVFQGGEPAEPKVVDEDGLVRAGAIGTANYGLLTCLGLATQAYLPTVATLHCEQNLALSSCEAPLSELSDCVRTVVNVCAPQPTGCRRYLDTPGCDGTMVVDNHGNAPGGLGADVSLRVE